MIRCNVWFRSQGTQWGLRPGDAVELYDGPEMLVRVEAELVIELLVMHFRNLQLSEHLRTGTAPRRSLAKMLSNEVEPPTKDVIARRAAERKSRKKG